jgi:hypothetical protein
LSVAEFGLPPTPHAIGDEVALILSDRTTDLEQKLIVWIITHWPLKELNMTPALGKLIDEQHLMDIVAGQPIRSGNEHALKGGHRYAFP